MYASETWVIDTKLKKLLSTEMDIWRIMARKFGCKKIKIERI